ncbi:DUF3558 family protein [Streptomyces sp. NPDC046805]|uniref:DUF3558 family protein n=1 Tax=Streptomyces sp. NPDC046805 TaxID=3155134 RepID=UPI0033D42BC7
MQQAAQRDDRRDQRDERTRRLRRALVCAAAVPVVLVAAGCSSGSGSDASPAKQTASSGSGKRSASPSPTVQPAAYKKLPKACGVLSNKTLDNLVPKAKSGKSGSSDDTASRGSCSWSSLDNNGVKGSEFRWLNVSLLRFDSDVNRGSGNKQAQAYYARQLQGAESVKGAKNTRAVPFSGAGDAATAVRYDLKKKEGSFKQQTVVARVQNVVVTLDYNGAGLAGETTPSGDALTKDAQKAAKEVVAAVTSANGGAKGGGSGKAGSAPTGSVSKSASPSASKAPSKTSPKSPSKSASASPSKSASTSG